MVGEVKELIQDTWKDKVRKRDREGVFKTRNGEMTKWRNGEMVLKIRAKGACLKQEMAKCEMVLKIRAQVVRLPFH